MQRTIHLFSSLLIFFFHDFCNQILQRESICHLVPYSFSSLHMLSFVCFSFCLLTSFHVSLSFWYLLSPVSLLLISTDHCLPSYFPFCISLYRLHLSSKSLRFPILECSRCRVLTVLNLAPFTTLSFSGSPSLRSYFPPNLNR
jgi:hypothetical protein